VFEQFAFLDLGAPELIIILIIILLLFGSKKLPQLSKSLGESARELKKGLGEGEDANDSKPAAKKETPDKKDPAA
jgi:sec-independent protein translocase protein TatA